MSTCESDGSSLLSDENEQAVENITQLVRLSDVFLVGPAMLWGSTYRGMPVGVRAFLAFSGMTTIAFNGLNYIRIASRQRKGGRCG